MTDTASPGTAPGPQADLILGRMTLEPAGKRLSAVFDYSLRRTTGAPRRLATSISLCRMRRNSLAGRRP